MKEFNMLVWLTQLGVSVAVPPALCTVGAVWLRQKFDLGAWILFVGIGIGLWLAVDGFRTSLKAMERMGSGKKSDSEPPAVSFNDHH